MLNRTFSYFKDNNNYPLILLPKTPTFKNSQFDSRTRASAKLHTIYLAVPTLRICEDEFIDIYQIHVWNYSQPIIDLFG